MHVAAEKGHLKIVECLVDKGANINSMDRFGVSVYYSLRCSTADLGLNQRRLEASN